MIRAGLIEGNGPSGHQQHILAFAWNVVTATPGDYCDNRHCNNKSRIEWIIFLCLYLLLISRDTLSPQLALETPASSTDLAKRAIDALRIKGRSSGAPYPTQHSLILIQRSVLNVTALIGSMIPDIYNADDSGSLGDLDFDFEKQDMVSAISHDQDIEEQLFNVIPMDKFASDTGLFSQMQAPLPLRPHRSFPKSSYKSSPTISGRELLNLEGRPSSEARMATSSMPLPPPAPSASALPTLRRKGKFGPDTSGITRDHRPQRISKISSSEAMNNGFQPHEMPMSPMSPSSYEWTQKFQEQISLHTHRPEYLNSQMQSLQDIQRDHPKQSNEQVSPREIFQHRKAYSEQSNIGSTYNHMVDYSHQVSHTVPRDMNIQIPMLSSQAPNGYDSSTQQPQQPTSSNGAFRQYRQVQSWGHAPADFASDYAVSPDQMHPSSWVDGLSNDATYFPNLSYSASNPQETPNMYTQEDLTASCYAPSLPLKPQAPFPSLPVNEVLLNSLVNRRPHTPPPSNPSASPTTPEKPAPSAQKQTRGSRRQNNTNAPGTLRLRKTMANLKPSRSLSTLKSTKSTGHLRGKKSLSHGLNHQGSKSPIKKKESQQGMNFDFMNFTPQDSQRILTGVAPSGSSKTKARREQEASEERRRLSLAAIKAIEVAGGDTEALKMQLKVEE